jgi:hypothetical protein
VSSEPFVKVARIIADGSPELEKDGATSCTAEFI